MMVRKLWHWTQKWVAKNVNFGGLREFFRLDKISLQLSVPADGDQLSYFLCPKLPVSFSCIVSFDSEGGGLVYCSSVLTENP